MNPTSVVPRKLSDSEKWSFLDRHYPGVDNYIQSEWPEYGMTVRVGLPPMLPRDYLVWVDASHRLWIFDVTGHPIVGEINKPLPDVDSIFDVISNIGSDITDNVNTLLIVGAAIFAALIWSRR